MTPLDHLPRSLQWFRGTWGSRVAHWLICAGGAAAAHYASLTQPERHRWNGAAEVTAALLLYAYLIKERQDYLDGNKNPKEVIGDLVGPVIVLIFVLVV